jgi:hypothetical protein
MYRTTLIPRPRRSLLAPLAVLVPSALLLALAIPALAVSPSHASSGQAAMQSITITASAPMLPKSFTTGLLSVTLVNNTKSEVTASFGRANPGETEAQIKAIAAKANSGSPTGFFELLKAITWIGGQDSVLPGVSQTAVLRLDTPGLYGGSVSPSNGPGHPYFFNVTAGAGAVATLPAGGVSVTLKNFKFIGLPKHLAAGKVTFQLTNSGTQVHEMQVALLDPGKTQQDVLKFLQSPQAQNGPPPAWVHSDGGMNIISPHQSADVTINFVPGYYVVLCFMPDVQKQNGEPHFMEGMIGHFTVS